MQYLYICQQPDNSYLFKGHGLESPRGGWAGGQGEGGAYGLSYSGGGGGGGGGGEGSPSGG